MKKLLFPCMIALAFITSTSQASLLYSQDFETLTNGTLAGQAGFTSDPGPVTVESGGLTYSDGAVSVPGGTKNITLSPTGANNWAFVNTFAPQSDTVYFSIAMTWTNQTENDFLYFALSDGGSEKAVALGNSGGIVINKFETAQGSIGGRIRGDTSGDTTSTPDGTASTSGENTTSPQFLVASLSKVSSTNYDTLNIWVNPSTLTEGTPTHTITQDMGIDGGLDTFYFFTGGGNETDEVVDMDSIRIGTTYDAVVIPEPGTLVLLGIALTSLAVFRRR
ncbi:MAG: PEP-CTERM sorting domain-containing protein [Opitutales bacterium]